MLLLLLCCLLFKSSFVVHRSISDSNEPAPTDAPVKAKSKKKKEPTKKKTTIPMLPLDNPAMGTRNKMVDPASPTIRIRSKKKKAQPVILMYL